MNKKILLMLIILTITSIVFVGCNNTINTDIDDIDNHDNKSTNYEDYIVIAESADVKTLNPIMNSDELGGIIIAHLTDGLTKELPDGTFVNNTAENIEISDDGLEYTITLKEGLKWSNGDSLTADDYRYSWTRAMDPEIGSSYAFIIAPYIKNGEKYNNGEVTQDELGIEVISDTQFKVTLETPTSFFTQLLSLYTYRPIHKETFEADPDGWDRDPLKSVTAGAYVLEEYIPDDKIVIKKNENYWDADKITMPGIVFKIINDQTTAMNAYNSEEVQINRNISNEEQKSLITSNSDFVIRDLIGTYFYVFNTDKEPFNNVNVRKAFALAIDREEITNNVLGLGQSPATRLISPSLLFSDGTNDNDKISFLTAKPQIEKAKEYLEKAGYPNGENFPDVTFLYNTSDSHKILAETIQQQLKENLGIEIELHNQDWGVFQESRTNGNFQIARHGWLGDYSDPTTMLDLFVNNSGYNVTQWRDIEYREDNNLNPEAALFNEYAKAYKSLPLGPERDEAMRNAEYEIVDEHTIILPIYNYVTYNLVNTDLVEGHLYTTLNKDFYGYMTWVR